MTSRTERIQRRAVPRASLAIDNRRAVVILLVLAFHSVLAYLNFLPPQPFAFDQPPFLWRAFPIVDSQRWMGFDLFCAWLDVFLMSFFFLVSGLFVWPSLNRKGAWTFLSDRLLHYVLYFFAGAAIGACGIERGLLGANGSLARHWAGWLAAAFASFVLWLLVMSQIVADPGAAPILWQITAALSFVLACFASCFLTLGASVRFAQFRTRLCDSLKDNAYGMYLIHYLFIVWLQFAMLATGLPAILKAIVVFAGTLALSWGATAGLRQVSAVSQIIGE